MDWRVFLTIFGSVFIAELGDKTQLATMLFASDKEVSKYTVFLAASAALVVAAAFGVLAGSVVSEYISERYLHYVAGVGFIGIGMFTLYHVSHVTCQVPGVRCHMSCVRCQMYFFFFIFSRQIGGACWWMVCYQRGLHRLVYKQQWF